MKTTRNALLTLCVLAAACAAFVSCDLLGMSQKSSQYSYYSSNNTNREKERLVTPWNIKFDGDEHKLTWGPVIGAVEYEVTIKLGEEQLGEAIRTGGTTLFYEPDLFTGFSGRVTFWVKAIANPQYGFGDSLIGTGVWDRIKIQIEIPQNVQFDRLTGELSWDIVEGADYYEVVCSYTGFEETVIAVENVHVFDNPERFEGITPINFTVTAISDDPDMISSDAASADVWISLDKPSGFSFTRRNDGGGSGTLKWTAVARASSYRVALHRERLIYSDSPYTVYSTSFDFYSANRSMQSGEVLTFKVRAYPASDSGYGSSEEAEYKYTWR